MTTSATPDQAQLLRFHGFNIVDAVTPAVRCYFNEDDIYSAPDWDSLVSHATNYKLCDCGVHDPQVKDLSHECVECGADVGVECSYNCSTNWI